MRKLSVTNWIFMLPWKFICWNSKLWCDGIWRWGRFRLIRWWKWSPFNGINDLIKETPENSLASSNMWGQNKKTIFWEPESESSLDTKSGSLLILEFPNFRVVRNKCLLLRSPIRWYFCYDGLNGLRCWSSQKLNKVKGSKVPVGLTWLPSNKESAYQAGYPSSIYGSERSPFWQPAPVFLPRKSRGQKNLEEYSSWGRKKVRHDLAAKQQQKGTGFSSVQFSRSVVSDSLQPHEPEHARPPCPSSTPEVHPNPCSLSQWCHPTISSSVVPFSSCPQSFPASGSL